MKRYQFNLVIHEGCDEFWEGIETKTGCDEVTEWIRGLLTDNTGLFENDNMELSLQQFTDYE